MSHRVVVSCGGPTLRNLLPSSSLYIGGIRTYGRVGDPGPRVKSVPPQVHKLRLRGLRLCTNENFHHRPSLHPSFDLLSLRVEPLSPFYTYRSRPFELPTTEVIYDGGRQKKNSRHEISECPEDKTGHSSISSFTPTKSPTATS